MTNKDKFVSAEEIAKQTDFASKVRELINGKGFKAHIITLGCQQNEADSERISGYLKSLGYTITEDDSSADLIIINTCAIREHAEKRALSIIGQYKHLKAQNPELVIAVCGCMVTQEARASKLKMSYP